MKAVSFATPCFPVPPLMRLALLWTLIMGTYGCARLMPPPADDAAARHWIERWSGRNHDIPPFKGLMRIQIEEGGQTTSGRAAWAVAQPNRLRLEWLSPLGQPLLSLAGDGNTITLYSAADRKFHRMNQSPTALERLIRIPIGIEALVDTLAGRPPLPVHAAARMTSGQGCRIVLENRWHLLVAELVSDTCDLPQSMTAYDPDGALLYRIHWLDWQAVQDRLLPRIIRVTSGAGDGFTMTMERFWFDPSMPAETFVIAPPE